MLKCDFNKVAKLPVILLHIFRILFYKNTWRASSVYYENELFYDKKD